ncbi:lactonase family protein [Blautia sp. 1033sp1_1033st1_G9_1033SCRN_220408]|uniref:lactonase family protein n=1 Tax=Blautia sp. 1033sp1_1033st1_G9_1033SCRN_220408 TaxID=3144490 RepID=UPI0034A17990
MYHFYVGTTPKNPPGYIASVKLDENGQLIDKAYYGATSPAYLCRKADRLYAVIENVAFGGLEVFAIGEGGRLTAKGHLMTEDVYSTFVSAEAQGDRVFVANYGTPSCAVYRCQRDIVVCERIVRKGVDHNSHVHCAVVTPDEKYLCVADVGTDEIVLYDLDSWDVVECIKFPKGSGPRHLVFSVDGESAYVITESSSEVVSLAYTPDREKKLTILKYGQTQPTGYGGAAGIRISPDGRFVLASNRNANSISVFEIREDGLMSLIHNETVPDGSPRDFQFTPDGRFLIVGLQKSNQLVVYKMNEHGGMKFCSLIKEIEQPTCIVF